MVVFDGVTNRGLQTGDFDCGNLIDDNYLDLLGTGSMSFNGIAVYHSDFEHHFEI